jgi:hypothetical protein
MSIYFFLNLIGLSKITLLTASHELLKFCKERALLHAVLCNVFSRLFKTPHRCFSAKFLQIRLQNIILLLNRTSQLKPNTSNLSFNYFRQVVLVSSIFGELHNFHTEHRTSTHFALNLGIRATLN